MSEMGDSYDPGPWKGYNFGSARMAYDPTAGRGYGASTSSSSSRSSTRAASRTLDDLVPATLKTDARSPLVIVTDGTGSMGDFPQTIFGKLPLLDLGVEDYLPNCEISFGMIGDAGSDSYPLQMQPFGRGKDLEACLKKIAIEGGGGGNQTESYDLAALYAARNIQMPKAKRPVMVFIADEGIYSHVDPTWASDHARSPIEKRMPTKELFEELKQKYSVYCIRKHYCNDSDTLSGADLTIHKQWAEYLGDDHIAYLNDPKRVVDVIFGILASETEKMDFFQKELTFRQKPEQVATVMKSVLGMTSKVASKVLPKKKGASHLLRDPTKSRASSGFLDDE